MAAEVWSVCTYELVYLGIICDRTCEKGPIDV